MHRLHIWVRDFWYIVTLTVGLLFLKVRADVSSPLHISLQILQSCWLHSLVFPRSVSVEHFGHFLLLLSRSVDKVHRCACYCMATLPYVLARWDVISDGTVSNWDWIGLSLLLLSLWYNINCVADERFACCAIPSTPKPSQMLLNYTHMNGLLCYPWTVCVSLV